MSTCNNGTKKGDTKRNFLLQYDKNQNRLLYLFVIDSDCDFTSLKIKTIPKFQVICAKQSPNTF